MNYRIIIPARYSSTRLPGKPLREIVGQSMIERVWRQAVQSRAEQVVIATDDDRIAEAARNFGAEVVMTRSDHPSGTDRLQEVAEILGWNAETIVVNVQGDEPLIPVAVIEQVAENLADEPTAGVATLCEPIVDVDTFTNPNVVKVVAASSGLAHYFSRAPIPWPRDAFAQPQKQLPVGLPVARHIGIYAYRVSALNAYVTWPPAPLECFESLEQLRFLAHGVPIHVASACAQVPGGVDTQSDLDAVIAHINTTTQ